MPTGTSKLSAADQFRQDAGVPLAGQGSLYAQFTDNTHDPLDSLLAARAAQGGDHLDALLSARAAQGSGSPSGQPRLTSAQQFLLDAQGGPDTPDSVSVGAPRPRPTPVITAPEPGFWDRVKALPWTSQDLIAKTPDTLTRALANVPTGLVNNPEFDRAQRFVAGMAKGTVGPVQIVANALPDSTGIPQRVNQAIADKYNSLPPKPAGDLVDRMTVGEVASPTNILMGAAVKPAVGVLARATQGAKLGAAGAASMPIENTDGASGYWMPKAVQTVGGTLAGGILGPVLGAVGDKVASWINRASFNPANAAQDTDAIINSALSEAGQKAGDIPPPQLDALRQKVTAALSQGKKLDTAAALRKSDFDAEGIQPTLGQITRSPMQWAEEQNLKGVSGAGEPLTLAFQQGNRAVSSGIGQYGANASEAPIASQKLADALRNYDQGQSAAVTSAYTAARNSAGKDLEIPLQGLAQDYADVIDRLGSKVPSEVKAKFAALGLDPANPSNQKQIFTFQSADDLRKLINDHVGSDPVTNKALGEIRKAVNAAQSSADISGGPFAPAVKLAAQRFQMHDEIPALEAAASGNVPDNFVQKFVINGQTQDVKKLAQLLRDESPDAFQEARSQMGADLTRKAFGENTAGDKAVSQEAYNRALRNFGTGKLEAFFDPSEIEQMRRLGRISAYQASPPAAAAANFFNTSSALANLLRATAHIPFAPKSVQLAGDKVAAGSALAAKVPFSPNLSPAQRAAMARILSTGMAGAGSDVGSQFMTR